ncbi:MAG: type II restriction endonuclease [candidate division WOR-3 bacterium]|nr:type II restriction endonuclease [candidate division WOR-3 bacterium]
MDKSLYSRTLGLTSIEAVVEAFHKTLIDTNRDHRFFVDWEKVKRNVDKLKAELNLLNTLIGSRAFESELRSLLERYPEVTAAIPTLLALRARKLKVIEDFQTPDSDVAEYDFTPRKLTAAELNRFVGFFDKTGLTAFFQNLAARSIQDYATGVEVGLDTHAHKNRSGTAMELALQPLVEGLRSDSIEVLFQRKFKVLADKYGIKTPRLLRDRKSDFILVKDGTRAVNIEVNFYSGTGSKPQEIVDSYILRQQELRETGIAFIWVTDGDGWRGQKNQIAKGFEKVDYLLNLHFARKGLLAKAVNLALRT